MADRSRAHVPSGPKQTCPVAARRSAWGVKQTRDVSVIQALLAGYARSRALDVLRSSDFYVIAADHFFDLSFWAAAVINIDNLPLLQRAHYRLFF